MDGSIYKFYHSGSNALLTLHEENISDNHTGFEANLGNHKYKRQFETNPIFPNLNLVCHCFNTNEILIGISSLPKSNFGSQSYHMSLICPSWIFGPYLRHIIS